MSVLIGIKGYIPVGWYRVGFPFWCIVGVEILLGFIIIFCRAVLFGLFYFVPLFVFVFVSILVFCTMVGCCLS